MAKAKEIYKSRVKKCLQCGNEYKYFPYEESFTKFCSRVCYIKHPSILRGRKHRPESIEKMRLARKGYRHSAETIEKIRKVVNERYANGLGNKGWFKSGHSSSVTEEGVKKQKETALRKIKDFIGKKNANWKGGKIKWLKKCAKIRDSYTCKECGWNEPEIMEVDHIKMKCEFPDLYESLDNLITLCPNCHRRKTNRDLRRLNTGRLLKP